jgi:hypothetical protein
MLELIEQLDDQALAELFKEVEGFQAFIQSPAESATPEVIIFSRPKI